jgi:hypothetical protein
MQKNYFKKMKRINKAIPLKNLYKKSPNKEKKATI